MNRSYREAILLSIRYVALMEPSLTPAEVLDDLEANGVKATKEDVDELLRTEAVDRDWVEDPGVGYHYRSLIFLDEIPF
jgi:hypothetical protein